VKTYGQYCPVAKALDVVGDRWTLLVIRELSLRGPSRYSDLQKGLPGIATNLLADRLRDLEAHGVVERREEPPPVAATLFSLTESGRELQPVVLALGKWGLRFMGDGPEGDEAFRSHWIAFPIARHLRDGEPDAPPSTVELHLDGEPPAVIEVGGGEIRTRPGAAASPDLVLEAPATLVLGVLVGRVTITKAKQQGLVATGDLGVLRRLQPVR
jgi:DNA-binding HxlR family transcriptional regulator